ncbi:glycoside hydrolase family 30 protein [Pseudoxanthomonas sacheonensis]|uniref:Glucosylceramidase n=1 Tax=Pseudoxanthomonas sacheonensis TaxID=443615 RepID=A0ABU1RXZ4_9GAMM|nr:glycoside hydrolase family 30 beta sandwich domain-containing protein [Pseudoxanthomonas sacheonensis]MDR6843225.1 glucosylceramidase [Pseudoxanthomonas sacheonensis]
MSNPVHRRNAQSRAVLSLLLFAMIGTACTSQPHLSDSNVADGAAKVEAWVTTSDHRLALQPVEVHPDSVDAPAEIEVDTSKRYQRMLGFGASITDSSAWLIQHKMTPDQRGALLQELFGRSGNGIGLDFARLTIGASDFSRHHYSLDDPPNGEADPQLLHFSIDPNLPDVVPVTRQALAVNPQLRVMASPWSAPGWMKDSGSMIKGTLRPEYYDAFARYLLKYVDAYAAEGIPIFALTVQNEPDFEPADYPGMRLNAPARARLIGDHLGPLIAARGDGPLIFDWDHNWDKPQEPKAVLSDPIAGPYVAAVAWHCYGGDPAAQSAVHEAFPDKDAYMTECSDGTWEPVRSGGLPLQTQQLIVQATRDWARGVLFWNLALDERGGPHAGGCDTCIGVVTIDAATGRVSRNNGYYALAHASRFVRRDAYRVASNATGDGLDNVAFQNTDDGSVVLIVTNKNEKERSFSVRQQARRFGYTLPAKSVATFRWSGSTIKP